MFSLHVMLVSFSSDVSSLSAIFGQQVIIFVIFVVSSQRSHDRAVGIDRMRSMGALLTTSESALL